MDDSSPILTAEFFHLAWLEVLRLRLDPDCYILKGGANMRYFFASPRYSEDIDFDAQDVDPARLESRVDETLASRPLAFILRTRSVKIAGVTKPKQTRTTQRWKVVLAVDGLPGPGRTKVEFSHRHADPRSQIDQVPPVVAEAYGLRPAIVRRYLPAAMIEQKISALATRAETQARDVFYHDLLFTQWPKTAQPGTIKREHLDSAAERAMQLPFESFRTLVVRFLQADVVEMYDRPAAWERMQNHVVDMLMALR